MAEARNVLWCVQQSMAEMGLARPPNVVLSSDTTVQQMLSLLNRIGIELVLGFPWEQLTKEYLITTVDGQGGYQMPDDWSYFIDQTQWDRTNHWPLLGPKSAQEWQWLKGGLLSSGPRTRYRVLGGQMEIWPVPSSTQGGSSLVGAQLAMEYVSDHWLKDATLNNTFYASVNSDTDIVMIDPWVVTSYLKLKYWEAKGLNTAAYSKDFVGIWEARIGKNKGAPMLTLAPRARTMLIGINSIPDGSWQVGA